MKALAFTGHRPQELELTGFTMKEILHKLYITIEKMIVEKEYDTFISGGAIGIDQMAFMCVHWLKEKYPHIRNIMAIPFEKQDIKWSPKQREEYRKMKALADELIYVDEIEKYQTRAKTVIGEYHGSKMQLRNMYMVDHAKLVIAVYNGALSGGTFNCIDYAKKKEKMILCIDLTNELKYKMVT